MTEIAASDRSENQHPKTNALTDDTLRRSGVRDWSGENSDGKAAPPPNPRRDHYEPQQGIAEFPHTDWQLHAQRPPERIDNIKNTRIYGLIGKNIFGRARDDDVIRVGHIPAVHANRPVSGNPSVASSDSTYIPTPRIGAPL